MRIAEADLAALAWPVVQVGGARVGEPEHGAVAAEGQTAGGCGQRGRDGDCRAAIGAAILILAGLGGLVSTL